MTRYIAAYDTENPACLAACRQIVAMHRRDEMPATFFIVGKTLEADAAEYRSLLDDPLFEIASHTYSHRMLRDQPFCGPAVSDEAIREEIIRGKQAVEQVFERPCLGLRPGCGFVDGLRGAEHALRCVHEAGYQYVSSILWGPDFTLPAPLTQAFRYEEDGYPSLWELPGHGWHENVLKGQNNWPPRRILAWPPQFPEAIPPCPVRTPEEEFAVNRLFLEKALAEGLPFVSLIWHPWSLMRFDPEMRMLDLTFAYARKLGLQVGSYADLAADMSAARSA